MKIIRMMMIGILIALSSSYILVTLSIFLDNSSTISGEVLRQQIIIAIILGAAIGLLSLLFEIEQIPFLLQLLLHVTFVTIFVLTAGYVGKWFVDFGIQNVLLSEAVIYVSVWCVMYMLQKKEIEDINAAIQQRKGE